MDLRNFFKSTKPSGKVDSTNHSNNSDSNVSKSMKNTKEIVKDVKVTHKVETSNQIKSKPKRVPIITSSSEDDDITIQSIKQEVNSNVVTKQLIPKTLETKVKESKLSLKRTISSVEKNSNVISDDDDEDIKVVKRKRHIIKNDSDDDFDIKDIDKDDDDEYNKNVVNEEDDDEDMLIDIEDDEDISKKKKNTKQTKQTKNTSKRVTKKSSTTDEDIISSPVKTRSPRKSRAKVANNDDDNDVPTIKVAPTSSSGGRPPWMAPAKEPPHKGSKIIPIGKEDCLSGLAFVMTGVNDSLERDDMKELIEKYGGVVRTAVSGKTSYLIAGIELEDGRQIEEGSKYKAALAKNVKIIDEDKLLDMIRITCKQPEPAVSVSNVSDTININTNISEPISQTVNIPETHNDIEYEDLSQSIQKKEPAVVSSKLNVNPSVETLFTTKYAPHILQDLVGNSRQINALKDWLQRWQDVHIKKTVKIQYTRQNPGAKACLLSGPPGIGKTTTVSVLAKLYNYELIELNASDKRNMTIIRDSLNNIIHNNSLASLQSFSYNKLILMDEVDGMSSGDRGGVAELIRIIKTTTVPIICICNDRDSQKIRSLINYCYDLTFTKPTSMDVIKRLNYIISKENIKINSQDLNRLITSTDGDMRQILNQLQMLYTLQSQNINISLNDKTNFLNQKDVILGSSAFDAVKILFQGYTIPFEKKYDAFFIDYDMTPMLVQQNYIDSYKTNNNSNNNKLFVQTLSDAAESLSDCDLINHTIRANSDYSLLTTMACMTIRTTNISQGRGIWPRFPAMLGKMSTQNKNKRLINDITCHTKLITNTNSHSMRLDYFNPLKRVLLEPLTKEGDVEATIEGLDEYCMTKDDFILTLNGICLPNDPISFDKIPSKTKASFTRKYNNTSHVTSNLFEDDNDLITRVVKGKKGTKSKSTDKSIVSTETESNSNENDFIDDDEEVYYY